MASSWLHLGSMAGTCNDGAAMIVKRRPLRSATPAGLGNSEAARAPFSASERLAIAVVVAAVIGFCIYGFASGAPSTVGYVLSVHVFGHYWATLKP